jgi:hypothetical protein
MARDIMGLSPQLLHDYSQLAENIKMRYTIMDYAHMTDDERNLLTDEDEQSSN